MLATRVVPWESRIWTANADSAGTNRAGHPAHSWSEGDAGPRFGCAVRRRDRQPQQGRSAQSRTLPSRFHVSAYAGGGGTCFKVPIWNLKARPAFQVSAAGLHAGGRLHAVERAAQPSRHSGQHCHHAGVRASARRRSPCTRNSPTNWPNWSARSRATTPASARCSTPSANSPPRPQSRAGKSDSTSRKPACLTA